MNVDQIITELKAERDRISRAIDALTGDTRPVGQIIGRPVKVVMNVAKVPVKSKTPGVILKCKDCPFESTRHGMSVHRAKVHRDRSSRFAQAYGSKDGSPSSDKLVKCIDCGKWQGTEAQLFEHLKTCEAYALADRSNGRH